MKKLYIYLLLGILNPLLVFGQNDTLQLGYQVTRSFDSTTEAISAIGGEKLETVPSAQLTQILESQLPGLGIYETSSDPGNAQFNLRIRGVSTVNGASPIFVVDGLILKDYNIDWITPQEIESISVLKDAAATAIYGLKGANGVILINTKHGKPGAFNVDVTADVSVQQLGIKPASLSSQEYMENRIQAWKNDGSLGSSPYSSEQLGKSPDNNWLKYFMRPLSTLERVGVSVSGGTKKVVAFANINFKCQTPLFKQTEKDYVANPRKTAVDFRAKVDIDITDWVEASVQIAGNFGNDRLAASAIDNNAIYKSIFNLPPTLEGPVNDQGMVTTMENVTNPTYGILNRSGFTKMATAYLMTVANLKFNLDVITEGLSIRGGVAFQSSSDRYNYSTRSYKKAYYDYNMSEWNTLGADIDTNLSNSISGLYQYAINYTASLDYDRTIGRHAIQAHFFTDYMTEQNKSMSSSYPALGLAYYSHNMGLNAGYSYAGRYAINATLGITGSDVFPSNNRYAFLPSVSLSWNIANEAFFKNAKDKVQQLKIRASYGISGLDAFASDNYRYLYKDMMRKDGSIELLGNPNLKPEKRSEINIGLDALLWNQLSINFDYFKRETNNMLIPTGVRVPQVRNTRGL